MRKSSTTCCSLSALHLIPIDLRILRVGLRLLETSIDVRPNLGPQRPNLAVDAGLIHPHTLLGPFSDVRAVHGDNHHLGPVFGGAGLCVGIGVASIHVDGVLVRLGVVEAAVGTIDGVGGLVLEEMVLARRYGEGTRRDTYKDNSGAGVATEDDIVADGVGVVGSIIESHVRADKLPQSNRNTADFTDEFLLSHYIC